MRGVWHRLFWGTSAKISQKCASSWIWNEELCDTFRGSSKDHLSQKSKSKTKTKTIVLNILKPMHWPEPCFASSATTYAVNKNPRTSRSSALHLCQFGTIFAVIGYLLRTRIVC